MTFIMEYIDGFDLLEFKTKYLESNISHKQIEQILINLLWPIAKAIKSIHKCGYVYRDINPRNIMIKMEPHQPPKPILIDFGTAKRIGGDTNDNYEADEYDNNK